MSEPIKQEAGTYSSNKSPITECLFEKGVSYNPLQGQWPVKFFALISLISHLWTQDNAPPPRPHTHLGWKREGTDSTVASSRCL